MNRRLPKYVRRKVAKGRTYYYFHTGQSDNGKPILSRLPDLRSPDFGQRLAAAQGARTRRAVVSGVLTIAALANLYEKSPRFRELAPATRRVYSIYLDRARAIVGAAPANELEPRDLRVIRDRMAETPSAANAMVRALGALYDWGRKAGHVTVRPTLGIELFKQGEHEPWPAWLIDEALNAEDDLVRRAVTLLYYTGQRIGDVCRLRKADVRGGRIELTPQKTERRRRQLSIPVHRDLRPTIESAPANALTLLAKPDGSPVDINRLRERIQAWAAGHGLHVVPHGLRKNAVNALLEAGCSVAEVQAITDQTLAIVEHYGKQRDRGALASAAILRWEQSRPKS